MTVNGPTACAESLLPRNEPSQRHQPNCSLCGDFWLLWLVVLPCQGDVSLSEAGLYYLRMTLVTFRATLLN